MDLSAKAAWSVPQQDGLAFAAIHSFEHSTAECQ